MNKISQILQIIIININALLDRLDKKSEETIKQLFYFIVFISVLSAAIIGYIKGKNAAKIVGIQIAESTDKTFEFDLKKRKEDGHFKKLLKEQFKAEKEKLILTKEQFKPDQNIMLDKRTEIIESKETEKRAIPFPKEDKLLQAPITDREVKELERVTPLKKNTKEIMIKETDKLFPKEDQAPKSDTPDIKPLRKDSKVVE